MIAVTPIVFCACSEKQWLISFIRRFKRSVFQVLFAHELVIVLTYEFDDILTPCGFFDVCVL